MHVFLIPDGNRRWAKKNGKPVFMGHVEGIKNFGNILSEAFSLDISYVTVWALSIDNIRKRTSKEITFLFDLLRDYFSNCAENKEIADQQVCVKVFGKWREYCPQELNLAVERCMSKTEKHKRRQLTVLLAYGGTDEWISAIKSIKESAEAEINENSIRKHLLTGTLPDVDLCIRTGGEPHLSDGALLWQMRNAHLYFTDRYWPEFSREEFRGAVKDFIGRERRYGA
jgi:undecaprenyl diphosphate synthase